MDFSWVRWDHFWAGLLIGLVVVACLIFAKKG